MTRTSDGLIATRGARSSIAGGADGVSEALEQALSRSPAAIEAKREPTRIGSNPSAPADTATAWSDRAHARSIGETLGRRWSGVRPRRSVGENPAAGTKCCDCEPFGARAETISRRSATTGNETRCHGTGRRRHRLRRHRFPERRRARRWAEAAPGRRHPHLLRSLLEPGVAHLASSAGQ